MKYLLFLIMIVGFSLQDSLAQSSGKLRSRKINEVTVVTKNKDKKGKIRTETIVTRYNRKGKPLEEVELREDGSTRRRTVYEYTYDGKEKLAQTFNSLNELKQEKVTVYHPVFRKRTQVYYRKNGQLDRSREYEYNVDGRRIRELRRNADGEVTRERRYYYDERGMLQRREEIRRNGEVEEIAYQYKY
jgi:hypothetical protein